MNIFPEITLSATEEEIISINMSNPAVKKYLHKLAYDTGVAIATGAKGDNESAQDYLLKENLMKGRLDVLNTLLSIAAPAVPFQS